MRVGFSFSPPGDDDADGQDQGRLQDDKSVKIIHGRVTGSGALSLTDLDDDEQLILCRVTDRVHEQVLLPARVMNWFVMNSKIERDDCPFVSAWGVFGPIDPFLPRQP